MLRLLIQKITELDHKAMLWIQTKRKPGISKALIFFTHSGSGTVWGISAGILIILEILKIKILPGQTAFLRSMGCALIAWSMGSFIKKYVNRPRPEEVVQNFHAVISAPKCQSFPSSHTSSAVAFVVALWMSIHSYTNGFAYWAMLVAFSRFYLGVHFPSDLIGGALFGMVCGVFIIPINLIFSLFS